MTRHSRNPEMRRTLLEVVERQIGEGHPPETKATLERLMAEGYVREDALELIACVLTSEIFDILKSNQPFDEARFVARLRALPRLPWDDSEPPPNHARQ